MSPKLKANSSLLCSANLQSVKSQGKSSVLLDCILKTGIDVFAMTETWLRDNDTTASLEFFPSETCKLFQQNRSSGRNGGGTALLIKKSIDVRKIESRKITSFEYLEFKISTDSLRVRIVTIYRPPYSTVHPVTPATFLEELSSYLESIILTPESLLLTGNFNFHVDIDDDPNAKLFRELLDSMGLKQYVTGPRHMNGHTLDLLITCEQQVRTTS